LDRRSDFLPSRATFVTTSRIGGRGGDSKSSRALRVDQLSDFASSGTTLGALPQFARIALDFFDNIGALNQN
jgi:hypothetical protein